MRYIKKLYPNDIKETYNPETNIEITLPNSILDLHSFTLSYTGLTEDYATTNTANTSIKRFFPRLSASVIDELRILVDGNEIQYTKEYGYLFNILNDVKNEKDEIDGDNFDTYWGHSLNAAGYVEKFNKLFPNTLNRISANFFINKWLGFLNEGERYFNAKDKVIKIQIKLAPDSILYRQPLFTHGLNVINTTVIKYKLSNIYANIAVVDVGDVPLTNSFNFINYDTTIGNEFSINKASRLSRSIYKPVNYCLGTFLPLNRKVEGNIILQHANEDVIRYAFYTVNNSIDNNKLLKDPNLLNSSKYFLRDGLNVGNTTFSVNNYDITPKMNIQDIYNETKRIFNSKDNKVLSLLSFEREFFCNAVEINDYSEGVKHIEWLVEPRNSGIQQGGTPILFITFTDSL